MGLTSFQQDILVCTPFMFNALIFKPWESNIFGVIIIELLIAIWIIPNQRPHKIIIYKDNGVNGDLVKSCYMNWIQQEKFYSNHVV